MIIAIRSRITGGVLYETAANSLREAVEQAVAAQVSLAGADLRNGDFRRGRFGGVDFRGADLRNADFTGAVLTGARMSHADCTGAKFIGAFMETADMENANLTRANLSGAKLARSNMAGVTSEDTVLTGADVTNATAEPALLTLAQFATTAARDVSLTEKSAWETQHPHGPVRLNAVVGMYEACLRLQGAYDGSSRSWMNERVGEAWEAAKAGLNQLKESLRTPGRPSDGLVPAAVAERLFSACVLVDSACKKTGTPQRADWKDLDRAMDAASSAMKGYDQWRLPTPLPDPFVPESRGATR